MEITGRPDLGADLHAPRLDDSGAENPTYALVREVRDGDIVLHYEKSSTAITAWSIAQGGFWEEETVWGTPRSTGPSGAPVEPYPREGLWHGLHGPFYLDEPLTLTEVRSLESPVVDVLAELEAKHGKPLYFPFQHRTDGLRAAQGYLMKMPLDLVDVLPRLPDLLNDAPVAFPSPPAPPTTANQARITFPLTWSFRRLSGIRSPSIRLQSNGGCGAIGNCRTCSQRRLPRWAIGPAGPSR
jgi:hypothetical protein